MWCYTTQSLIKHVKCGIDVIELDIDKMHQNNVWPDPLTYFLVFPYINTAMEALQVLSMRMISQEDNILDEKKMELEENYIFAGDSEVQSRVLELFKSYYDPIEACA